ncbi:hypothetical protein Chor_006211 [Crotalus horridus]
MAGTIKTAAQPHLGTKLVKARSCLQSLTRKPAGREHIVIPNGNIKLDPPVWFPAAVFKCSSSTGRIRVHGIGGGNKQCYRMIDFQRLHYPNAAEPSPFEEKVLLVRYDPCRTGHIALVAGEKRKRWIIATENMVAGDIIKTSGKIERMAVSANDGDAYPVGALPLGTLISNLESHPGKGAQYIRAAGLDPVLETCMATVGRVSNVEHNQRNLGKAGRNRWLGKRPDSGLWQRKGGWAGRKIRPLPAIKSYVNLPVPASQG